MNYWQDKPEFWKNKTQDNPIYKAQKQEMLVDIMALIGRFHIEQVIDVCGYDGEIGRLLKHAGMETEYINLDFQTKIDVSKPWADQIKIDTKKYTLAVTGISLITFPLEQVTEIIKQMEAVSKCQYIFEQKFNPARSHGEQINDEYGGKWNYDWFQLFPNLVTDDVKESISNPNWVKFSRKTIK
jgi:hypothetical protein